MYHIQIYFDELFCALHGLLTSLNKLLIPISHLTHLFQVGLNSLIYLIIHLHILLQTIETSKITKMPK